MTATETFYIVAGVIAFFINCIGLFIILIVALISVKPLIQNDKLVISLKYLFYLTILSCCIALSCNIAAFIGAAYGFGFDSNLYWILYSVMVLGLYMLMDSMLAILFIRLHTTFKQSMYKISNLVKNTFILMYCVIIMTDITILIIRALIIIGAVNNNSIKSFIGIIRWILYCVCAIGLVSMFSKNLLSVALRQTSVNNVDNIVLKQTQKKMIDLTSRYVGLFAVAVLTTFIDLIVAYLAYFDYLPYVIHLIMAPIDVLINAVCLFLQYSFAANYYKKYCACIHACFKKIITRNMMKSISQIKRNGYDGCANSEL
eukprot:178306_1